MPRLLKRFFSAILLTVISISCSGQKYSQEVFVAPENSKRERLFDTCWLFQRGEVNGGEQPGFNDSGWQKISLPLDWSIEDVPLDEDSLVIGPFSNIIQGAYNNRYFMSGIGWYRIHFRLTKRDMDMQVAILFDGVYKNCDVWINGPFLAMHPNGYTPFYYSIMNIYIPLGKIM